LRDRDRLFTIKDILHAGDLSLKEKLRNIQAHITDWNEKEEAELAGRRAQQDLEWKYRHQSLPGKLVEWLKQHPGQHTSIEIAAESSLEMRDAFKVAVALKLAAKRWGDVNCEKCRCGKALLYSYKEADDGRI